MILYKVIQRLIGLKCTIVSGLSTFRIKAIKVWFTSLGSWPELKKSLIAKHNWSLIEGEWSWKKEALNPPELGALRGSISKRTVWNLFSVMSLIKFKFSCGVTIGDTRLLMSSKWDCRLEVSREEKSSINFCLIRSNYSSHKPPASLIRMIAKDVSYR